MRRVLVTGGAGFVGSHVAEHYAGRGAEVVVLDNLSRAETLPTASRERDVVEHNWRFLATQRGVERVRGDVRDTDLVARLARDCDAIVHCAAQVAVTASLDAPRHDFEVNALGTFNVLEAARANDCAVVNCSTNKVYGDNVNRIRVAEGETRYAYDDPAYAHGVPEALSVDGCEHTPYGASKLAADLYVQDWARTYGLRTGVFRMSCIYGTRQFGNEDQGWVAHFLLRTLRGQGLTLYGDGKQVRDVLWVGDLVRAFDAFLASPRRHGTWNAGGGAAHTTSLLEFLALAREETGRASPLTFADWRPGDQKVYVSDVRQLGRDLGWAPRVGVREGVRKLVAWARETPAALGRAAAAPPEAGVA